jgi:hypothetical protein
MPLPTIVYLDERLLARLSRIVPAQDLSQFVNSLLVERLALLGQAEFADEMREGYLATRQERQALNATWEIVDGETWPS